MAICRASIRLLLLLYLSIIGVLPYPPSEKGCVDSLFQVTAPASPLNPTLESGLGLYCVPLCCFLVTWQFFPLFCKLVDGWECCFPAPDVSFISAVPRAESSLNNYWGMSEWGMDGYTPTLSYPVTCPSGDEIHCKKWVSTDPHLPSRVVRSICF